MYILGKRPKQTEIGPDALDKRKISMAVYPSIHPGRDSARREAERLARIDDTSEFLIFELLEGVSTQAAPLQHRKYS